ncbi:hypothetical protein F4811DRAFT_539409 [Daldinia bambusicola]|nr:hypothetical protein F4811DRAFT_539409 [Daldinia bambusicola]
MKPKKTKAKSGKLAEKLRKFEPAKEEEDDDLINGLAAPPPRVRVAPPVEEGDKSSSSKDILPGGFPEEDENEIIDIVDIAPVQKKKMSSKKSKAKAVVEVPSPPPEVPIPPPPPEVPLPPPAVPDGPPTPPPEVKSSKRDRHKVSRDGGAPWTMWSATPHKEERRSKPRSEEKRVRMEKEKEKEKSSSSKGESSDRDNKSEEHSGMKSPPIDKPRMSNVFQSTPPISRSMSTRDKYYSTSKSTSRRHSVDMANGLVSPPPEEIPAMSSKAAKIFGVDKSQKSRTRKVSMAYPLDDEDVMMTGVGGGPSSPEKSARKRSKVETRYNTNSPLANPNQPKTEDDAVMFDAENHVDAVPLKRSGSNAKKGISGLFGGLMSSTPRPESRPEPRRRSTYHTTDDEARPDKRVRRSTRDYHIVDEEGIDDEREARRAARRARRAEEKAAEEARLAKEEERRERRRRHEEEAEARKQAEREARRAERRATREREAERLAVEAKEAERAERRRLRRLEKEAAAAEEMEAEARRAARAERRRARYADASGDEEERRRRRHEARRAEEKAARRRTMPADEYVYPQERSSRHTIDDRDRDRDRRRNKAQIWPHSGTDSWVKDHSDAGPPPTDGPNTNVPPEDDEEARRATRRAARRRAKYGDMDAEMEDDRRRRRTRHDERGQRDERNERDERDRRRDRRVGGSDGSGDKNGARGGGPRESFFTDSTPRSSWWRKLTGS